MNNNDNTTSHSSTKYDYEILKTIPYYNTIHDETINFIKAYNVNPRNWLDTGCGTGIFAMKVLNNFILNDFVLADPSKEMLEIAKIKLQNNTIKYYNADSASININNNYFDVITAIQSHHYLSIIDREKATIKCYNLLANNGIYISFENTRPINNESIYITKEYWKQFQISNGKSIEQAETHLNRFDREYFPISINDHYELYNKIGFKVVDFFWKSYMQVGFYCIK